jgi:hypothetical protein
MVTFALMWLGEAFLCLKLVKWVIHGSAALYSDGSLGPVRFHNTGPPELDSEYAADVRYDTRTSRGANGKTAAAGFSVKLQNSWNGHGHDDFPGLLLRSYLKSKLVSCRVVAGLQTGSFAFRFNHKNI